MDTVAPGLVQEKLRRLEKQQSLLSKKIISALIIKSLGATLILIGVIVQYKFRDDNNRVRLYWIIISIGIVTYIISFIKMKSAKKEIIQNNNRVKQLQKGIIAVKEQTGN